MVLLKSVVEISPRQMPHLFAELGSDRSGIGIMAIGGDPIWSDADHRLGRSKECPGSSKVTMLAQPDVNQGAVAINRPIQIPPSAPHPDIRLINVPAGANPAFASPTQVLGKRYGTTYRIIAMISILQIATVIISRGDVTLLGEAYAFGVAWSFAMKALAVTVLRFTRPDADRWRVPLNLRLDKRELPIGLM